MTTYIDVDFCVIVIKLINIGEQERQGMMFTTTTQANVKLTKYKFYMKLYKLLDSKLYIDKSKLDF